jgi:hypothetical protein
MSSASVVTSLANATGRGSLAPRASGGFFRFFGDCGSSFTSASVTGTTLDSRIF